MEEKRAEELWRNFNSIQNSVETPEEDALSLCDLPHTHHHQSKEDNQKDNNTPLIATEETHQEDFDFCSLSKETEMCAADDVFYQGQILPLRQHSTTCKNVFIQNCDNRDFRQSVSSSEDHFSSGGPISSRSSSTGSSAAAADHKTTTQKIKFHSHPSPSPKTHFSTNKQRTVRFNARKKSSAWNILRLGLVSPPPEIAFQDLKNRYPSNANGKNFAKRNSSHSRGKKRIKRRDFFGGCRCCSTDAVDAVRSRVVVTKRSERDGESEVRVEEEDNLLGKKSPKKRLSHYRTFEWLKQLSLEGKADEP